MSRKPSDFARHPVSYDDACKLGQLRGVCRHVVDGDTFDVFLDLGLMQYAYITIRLHGVDTPEIFSPKSEAELALGQRARLRTAELIDNKPIMVKTYKDQETFGRFVADVWYYDEPTSRWMLLGETLRGEGLLKQ